jgi:hypothetical protein
MDMKRFEQEIREEYENTSAYELRALMVSIPRRVIREIQRHLSKVEKAIQEQYPHCIHVDLEISHG